MIPDYQTFYNIVNKDMAAAVAPLGDCIQSLSKICPCKKDRKQKKIDECNELYVNIITSNGESLKEYFKTKTSDNEVIFNQKTHYTILRLSLK